jgi:2-polyprenyl-3-methyl-5-hydroxy-6-metoxy-1,4-benzoquinol methylase
MGTFMERKHFTYSFKNVERCCMCHAPAESFVLLGQRLNQSQGFTPSNKIGITTRVVQCSNCGLIFSNPMPVPEKLEDHYGVPPESYWSDAYFNIDENYFNTEIAWLKKLIDVKPGLKSLDIGAGIGKQMIALRNHGFDTYGIEPSYPFYQRAVDKMGIPKSQLQCTGIEGAEFHSNTFDFISFGAVLEHLYEPSESLSKAMQWLKPGGIVHIEVPNAQWLISRLVNVSYKVRGKDYVTNISPMHNPFHLYEFTLKSFEKNGKINNYTIKDSAYYVCETFMPKLIDAVLRAYMKHTETGMQLVVWLQKNS